MIDSIEEVEFAIFRFTDENPWYMYGDRIGGPNKSLLNTIEIKNKYENLMKTPEKIQVSPIETQ